MSAAPDQATAGARIQARGLTRRFGPHRALDDVSLEIEKGETFGLLGANGAGKTTFIRLLTGYILPSAGSVTIDGISPTRHARAAQALLGYVPETPRLYPELRVEGFLRFVAGLRGITGTERKRVIEAALHRFRLEDSARRLIGNLSKGYRQRVSLAQAFLHDPPLLIFDEPTSGLDPQQQEEVRGVIADLRGRRTILLCTHDLNEARSLASRVAILNRGVLVGTGDGCDLLGGDDPLGPFRGGAAGDTAEDRP